MKKFTRNFLLGEHSIVWFLRKIGLGLALVLWTTLAFAQEAQDTYHLKVASWDSCYQTDNVYSVPVHMKDFMKIKKFEMVLNYTNTVEFDFIGLTKVNSNISSMTVQQLTDGNLTFKWESATPVSILPDNSENLLFILNFKLAAFQHQYLNANTFTFPSVLTWKKVELYNVDGQCEILTENITNGAITVKEKWESVVVDVAKANCIGNMVTATVTTPAYVPGMLYSFNGNDYNALNKTSVYAPSVDNILVIKDATCISYIKKFDVSVVSPLTFTAATPVNTLCAGGLGDIEILAKNGTAPYTYYVIPEAQWSAGDLMQQKLLTGDVSLLGKYTFAEYVIQKPAGNYWVAVQDANGCAALTGTNMMSWWKQVVVVDNKTPIATTPGEGMMLMTTCYGQGDGRIQFTISGGTPYTTGYHISVKGVYVDRDFGYDSNEWCDCETEPQYHGVLVPGKYEYTISDSLGCTYVVTYEVKQPKKIVFNVDHTDAGCKQDVGELWISSVDASTGSGPVSSWRWHYTTDPTWATHVSPWFSLSTKVTDLPAGVYYVEVEDGNGCAQEWTNAAGDNAIKILTTEFDIVYTPIKCAGDPTTVTIVLVSGDANHEFAYKAEKWVCEGENGTATCTWEVVGSGWQTSNKFTGIMGDVKYRYSVWDKTVDCVLPWEQIIPNPPALQASIVETMTQIPSCPGNIDGNVTVRVTGGRPWGASTYNFQIDNRLPVKGLTTNDFAVGAGEHTIVVTDSAGCSVSVKVVIPDGENMINFVDKIYVDCAGDSVNLFNAVAWTSGDEAWYKQIGLDKGYLLHYSWYPTINHDGDDDEGWLYEYWTSGGDWVKVPVQGNIASRNPKLYISTQPWVKKSDIVTMGEVVGHESAYTAGTYYLVAKDEWGCYSNVDTVKIIQPKALELTWGKTDAGCYNTWTGEITVSALNGRFAIPNSGGARYQFVLVQQPDIFNHPDWYGTQVTWKNFQHKNNTANDSTLTLAVQKGTYWLAIRDYCAIHDPSQIIIINEIVIGGLDPIKAKATANPVLCNGDKNGSVIVTEAAGGSGGYVYELQWNSGMAWPSGTKWPFKNSTGIFNDLYAGVYTVTVKDSKGCDPYIQTVTVTQPDKLVLSLTGVDASCFGAQDGIIRYTITGGTAPFKESTNNGANWYDVAETTRKFDRRAGAGTYIVWLMDKNGCMSKDTLVILQPGELKITSTPVTNVSCPPSQAANCKVNNVVEDGTIKVFLTGGWNATDVFNYYVTATKGTDVRTWTANTTNSSIYAHFTGLGAGEWTIKAWEWSPTIPYDKPYIMDPDYADHYASGWVPTRPDGLPNPQQNPNVAVCFATKKVTVGSPDPITYDVEYIPVACKDTESGEIHVHNVAGGTGPYWFMLEGPEGYVGNGVWRPTGAGVMEYLFTGLPWGHYNVFIKDSKGCVVCLESGEVNNQKDLTLMVSLVKDADCYDTATGQIKLEATSFPVGYTLQYAIELASVVEKFLFPLADQDFIDDLNWQDSQLFDVKAGVWIGYVKATDPVTGRICYQGHSTDINGNRIMNHRVVVNQPTQVQGYVWDKLAVSALCYGDKNGKIKVSGVWGGNGGAYSAHVFGTAYDGTAVSEWYSDVEAGDYLDKLYASTDLRELKDTAKMNAYTVVFLDKNGCMSPEYKVAVRQPEKFEIDLVLKQNAFICPEDLAGVFEIRVVSGGTGLITYKYEAWDGNTMKLSSPWGAINTFQGPAGLLYKGWAQDANGCLAYADTFVAKPAEIVFVDIKDISCYGDPAATTRITVTGEPGRTFKVRWQKYPDTSWSGWSASFDKDIVLTGLTYGDAQSNRGHYTFQVMDNMGCTKTSNLITFVPVQIELNTCCAEVDQKECSGILSITITGGVPPYDVYIDGVKKTGSSWELPSGTHKIKVMDTHECISEMDVTIDSQPVTRTAELETYVGESAKFMDAEAGVDTMLAKGVHVFTYVHTNGCTRTLTVTVSEKYRQATIGEIQGTGDVSPLKDLPRGTKGTVTAVVPGVGYFIQDTKSTVRCGLYVIDATTVVLEGTGVYVEGKVDEINGVTSLIAANVEFIAPEKITPKVTEDPSEVKKEDYESMLVTVTGARFMGTPAPDNSWVIKTTDTNTITVNDLMYNYVVVSDDVNKKRPVNGDWYSVTGIINGALDLFKLEPRKETDVINLSRSTSSKEIDNLQFKVYPNPFSDVLNIENSNKLTRVTVTNIAGQRVIDIQYPESVIRTSNLVSGVYVITLFTEDGIAKSERMVKR